MWTIFGTPKLMIQKTNKNFPRRNKYILENILLNIFKFYISKYIIKFLQSRDNNKKKFGFYNFAEHRLRTSALYTWEKIWNKPTRKCEPVNCGVCVTNKSLNRNLSSQMWYFTYRHVKTSGPTKQKFRWRWTKLPVPFSYRINRRNVTKR